MTVKSLCVTLILISNVFATNSNTRFVEKKTKMLERVSGQIAALESAKKCIEKSMSEDVLPRCFDVAVAERKKEAVAAESKRFFKGDNQYREQNRNLYNIIVFKMIDPQDSFQNQLKPIPTLQVYDNIKMEGKPSFIIDNNKIIDQRSTKPIIYKYEDFYKGNIVENKYVEDFEKIFSVKNLPLDFITVDLPQFNLELKKYDSGIATISDKGKLYYFKVNESDYEYSALGNIEWPTEFGIEAIKNFEKNNKEFADLMNGFRQCINAEDYNCLVKKYPDFEPGIKEWSVFKDPILCKQYKEAEGEQKKDEIINKVTKKIVNWNLYQDFFSYNDSTMKIFISNTDFGKETGISIEIEGEIACDRVSGLSMYFSRKAKASGWAYSISALASED